MSQSEEGEDGSGDAMGTLLRGRAPADLVLEHFKHIFVVYLSHFPTGTPGGRDAGSVGQFRKHRLHRMEQTCGQATVGTASLEGAWTPGPSLLA